MALRKVALAKVIKRMDITEKELTRVEIYEVDGVATVFVTYMEPDSRGLLRPQTTSTPLLDTITSARFEAWLDSLA